MALYFKRKKVAPIVLSSKPDMLQSRVDETKSCKYLFYYYMGTNKDCVKNLNTTGVTDMSNTFSHCSNIPSLDLNSFDTSNVTTMSNIFGGCEKLTLLDLSNFNTQNVTDMSYMFASCGMLTSLDLSSFDTPNVTNMSYMFNWCQSLQHLDISNFDFTNVTSYTNMFFIVPSSCEILVKDETAKEWITSKFTNLTNVKVKGAI